MNLVITGDVNPDEVIRKVSKMFKSQKADALKLRDEINTKIVEVQLQQLDNEIRECLRIMETSADFLEEEYKRYENLKKEKEALINSQEMLM